MFDLCYIQLFVLSIRKIEYLVIAEMIMVADKIPISMIKPSSCNIVVITVSTLFKGYEGLDKFSGTLSVMYALTNSVFHKYNKLFTDNRYFEWDIT